MTTDSSLNYNYIQYMKIPSSNLGRACCVQKLFMTFRTFFVHNMFSPCSAKRRASDKDLPVWPLKAKSPTILPPSLPTPRTQTTTIFWVNVVLLTLLTIPAFPLVRVTQCISRHNYTRPVASRGGFNLTSMISFSFTQCKIIPHCL